jgi:ribose 5-phosphate isomerase A
MTSTVETAKVRAAEAALETLRGADVIGVGTGSTVHHFITALAEIKHQLDGAVASSEDTAEKLRRIGIRVLDLNAVGTVAVYIDGADEATRHGALIKGGGGALTREKILAAASRQFVCMIHRAKLVDVLGNFGLPVEIIPMARSYVARELARRGGDPRWREGFVTDNGNYILDVHGLSIVDPQAMEAEFNGISGVVSVGLFARRGADLLLIGDESGVERIRP